MPVRYIIILFFILVPLPTFAQNRLLYEVNKAKVSFHSDAPQELIRASTTQLFGVIDARKKIFAFKVVISSFTGFNTPLQKEHFNENYMESKHFPEASYSGKIIEDIDLTKEGVYDVRTKGKLKIHGIEQERIIKAHIIVEDDKVTVSSEFVVALADYDIKIPRVVYEKLAPEISVSINAILFRRY